MSSEWIFEALEAFLASPVWIAPVISFIESSCQEFEDCEENKLSYTAIHNQYQELVDSLLEGFLADLGVTMEQFEKAFNQLEPTDVHRKVLVEQVLSAGNFELFKLMMVKTKLTLQQQAASMNQSPASEVAPVASDSEDTEDQILARAIEMSKVEYQQQLSEDQRARQEEERAMELSKAELESMKREQDEIQMAIDLSIQEYMAMQAVIDSIDNGPPITEPATQQASLPKHMVSKQLPSSQGGVDSKESGQVTGQLESMTLQTDPAACQPIAHTQHSATAGSTRAVAKIMADDSSQAKEEAGQKDIPIDPLLAAANAPIATKRTSLYSGDRPKNEPIDEELVRKRREHLRQVRDKLVAAKKAVREEELASFSKSEAAKSRPKSAHAARAALATSKWTPPKTTGDSERARSPGKRPSDRLVAQLKKEVISKVEKH